MKTLISNYTFNKDNKTVTFSDYNSVVLERVLLITNVTTNQIIYLFSDPSMGGSVNGNVLTLDYNTTTMSSSDKLQIFYDSVDTPATDTSAQAMVDMIGLLKRIAEYTSNLDVTDSNNRLRVNIDALGTIAGSSMTLGSAQSFGLPIQIIMPSGQTAFGSAPGSCVWVQAANTPPLYYVPDVWHNIDQARAAYATSIRSQLSFS